MKRHEFDSLSFISGLVITSIGLVFLLLPEVGDIVNLFSDVGSWFWPLVFIGTGIAVLVPAAAMRNVSSHEVPEENGSSPT